ncbi:MAG: thioesterase family protein [Bacteroidales bacterium]
MDLSVYQHKKKIEIRYDDLDTIGHVNNKAYLSYLEEARLDFHKQVFSWKKNLDFNSVVARIEINYKKPLFYGDNLTVHTRLSNLGTKSFELETLFVKEAGNAGNFLVTAEAKVVLVAINPESGLSVELPAKEKEILKNFNLNK